MPKPESEMIPEHFVAIQWGVAAAHSLVLGSWFLLQGNADKQATAWLFSPARLVLALAPLALFATAVFFLAQALSGRRGPDPVFAWILRSRGTGPVLRILAGTMLAIGIVALLLPPYRFAQYADYFLRARPLLLWIGMLGLQAWTIFWLRRWAEARRHLQAWWRQSRPLVRPSGWIMLALLILGILALATLRGVTTYEDFRYEAGVPVLVLQIAASVLAGFAFRRIVESRHGEVSSALDRWTFLGIWLVAAIYWAAAPVTYSYMNPAPVPPNHEVYPYSDAARYDLQGQMALLGQGLNGGRALDNPLYPAFLALVHVISGQDFVLNMAMQAAALAILPAIAYLAGKTLHSRALGIACACMVAFQGSNAIAAAALINTASPKQMLTDFPTAVGVALAMLTAISLVQQRDASSPTAIWHGGVLGLTTLIRPTGAALLGIAPMIALLQKRRLRFRLLLVLVTVAAFALALAPWGIRNAAQDHNPIGVYLGKLSLITRTRFRDLEGTVATRSPRPTSTPSRTPEITPATGTSRTRAERSYGAQKPGSTFRLASPAVEQIPLVILSHFANNLIGSVLILPTSPALDDLRYILKAPNSIWTRPAYGVVAPAEIPGLLVSTALLAIGAAALWRRAGLAAAVPALVFALYQFANAVGRTSGGRYLVPTDWIVLLYYAAGLLTVFDIGGRVPRPLNAAAINNVNRGGRAWLVPILCVLALGASPILVEHAFPVQFPRGESAASAGTPEARQALLRAGYSPEQVDGFFASRKGVSLIGQAMYPRWFSWQAVVNEREGSLPGLEFPHLEFSLIGPERGPQPVFLFAPTVVRLPNAAQVLVIGCEQGSLGYVEALAVVPIGQETGTRFRASPNGLNCPQALPICDSGGHCQ